MASDLKGWDIFRNPVWLLRNLFAKYKVVSLQTYYWTTSTAGSGGLSIGPDRLNPYTGTTPNSLSLAQRSTFGLNSGNGDVYAIDYSKRLEWYFTLARWHSDPQAVARIQLKNTSTEGALADKGLGLEIQNYAVYGEAYGTARNTVSLMTLTDSSVVRVRIVHVPNSKVEFWINGIKLGELTGTAVPTNVVTPCYYVISLRNGSTGGVDANVGVGHIWLLQEW